MNAPFTYSSPTLSVEALKHSIAYKLMFTIGKDPVVANKHEWLNATLFAVRDRLVERWLRSNRAQLSQETRQVYYLSMEFLIGRTLSNAMLSLGIYEDVQGALEAMGLNLEELIDEENDPGLGNGGLGQGAVLRLIAGSPLLRQPDIFPVEGQHLLILGMGHQIQPQLVDGEIQCHQL